MTKQRTAHCGTTLHPIMLPRSAAAARPRSLTLLVLVNLSALVVAKPLEPVIGVLTMPMDGGAQRQPDTSADAGVGAEARAKAGSYISSSCVW